jgi:hypothetical protein
MDRVWVGWWDFGENAFYARLWRMSTTFYDDVAHAVTLAGLLIGTPITRLPDVVTKRVPKAQIEKCSQFI